MLNVVVVGSRERTSPEEKSLVLSLLEGLRTKYRNLVIISTACDKGIGAFVKERCLEEKVKGKPDFAFVEIQVRIWAKMSRSRLSLTYSCRNSALSEIGDEFHVFVTANRKSGMEDIIRRAEAAGKPYYIYSVGTKEIKMSEIEAKEPVLSEDLLEKLRDDTSEF